MWRASPDQPEREYLAKIDNQFLASELAMVLLFLIGLATSTEAHLQAARLFLGGPYPAVFWVGVVGIGIVLPLIIQSLAVTHRVPHTPLAPVLVLLGGLALRFARVKAHRPEKPPQEADTFQTVRAIFDRQRS